MKSWKIEYVVAGETYYVICMRNSYAASVIRSLVKRGVSKETIKVVGDINQIEAYERALAIALK